jgi:hypothetical protein
MSVDRLKLAAALAVVLCNGGCAGLPAQQPTYVQAPATRPVENWRAVPFLRGEGPEAYREFLEQTLRPRAFALSIRGDWAWNTGAGSPEKALAACERRGMGCLLYAVDEEIVFPGLELGILDTRLRDEED